MTVATLTLRNGIELPVPQAFELFRLIRLHGVEHTHWHFNECGCCVTLHGSDFAYVVGPDGVSDLYPGRGCSCDD